MAVSLTEKMSKVVPYLKFESKIQLFLLSWAFQKNVMKQVWKSLFQQIATNPYNIIKESNL